MARVQALNILELMEDKALPALEEIQKISSDTLKDMITTLGLPKSWWENWQENKMMGLSFIHRIPIGWA